MTRSQVIEKATAYMRAHSGVDAEVESAGLDGHPRGRPRWMVVFRPEAFYPAAVAQGATIDSMILLYVDDATGEVSPPDF